MGQFLKTIVGHSLIFLSLPTIQAQEDCIFDRKTQTDEFVKKVPEFQNYTWDDSKKEATIKLADGNVMIASRGGCYSFGINATISYGSDFENFDRDFWFKKALWVGKRLFSDSDYMLLKSSIQSGEYEEMSRDKFLYILFPHDYYAEFSMAVKPQEDSLEFSIGYYFN